jgi:hypothetical protein
MIKEDYVSFETAKLLKEKGFKEITQGYINTDNEVYMLPFQQGVYELGDNKYLYPTLQMTTKWLREVHNIVIVIDVCKYGEDNKTMYAWTPVVIRENCLEYPISQTDGSVFGGICEMYHEAVENGIIYCLRNLV